MQGLGLGILLFSFVVKVPQILALRKSQSAEGLSPISFELEEVGLSIHTAYGFLMGLPFNTFGEAVIILVQNTYLLAQIYKYKPLPWHRGLLGFGLPVAGFALAYLGMAQSIEYCRVCRQCHWSGLVLTFCLPSEARGAMHELQRCSERALCLPMLFHYCICCVPCTFARKQTLQSTSATLLVSGNASGRIYNHVSQALSQRCGSSSLTTSTTSSSLLQGFHRSSKIIRCGRQLSPVCTMVVEIFVAGMVLRGLTDIGAAIHRQPASCTAFVCLPTACSMLYNFCHFQQIMTISVDVANRKRALGS